MINNKFLKKINIFTTKTKEDKQKVEKIEVFVKKCGFGITVRMNPIVPREPEKHK